MIRRLTQKFQRRKSRKHPTSPSSPEPPLPGLSINTSMSTIVPGSPTSTHSASGSMFDRRPSASTTTSTSDYGVNARLARKDVGPSGLRAPAVSIDQAADSIDTSGSGSSTAPRITVAIHHNAMQQEQPATEQFLPLHQAMLPAQRRPKSEYRLDDFRIQRTLGTGTFGRVHLAQSRYNGHFYAIKVLKKDKVVAMKQVEHTNSEQQMLELVQHPFVVNLWGVFQDMTNLYMVMDFIAGGELFTLLRRSGRFPDPVAKFYSAEVALALHFLHNNDIIYRDLKPENILLDSTGHIKIADFGFAKLCPNTTWTLCGTPDYLAPEIVAQNRYNKSVDWYALGVLIYEMSIGFPPFHDPQATSPVRLYERIAEGTARIRWPPINPAAKDIILRLMESDPSRRFGNMANGGDDVFKHEWYSEVDWVKLESRVISPPYVPPISSLGDASAFDRYPEGEYAYGETSELDQYGHLFPAFSYTP